MADSFPIYHGSACIICEPIQKQYPHKNNPRSEKQKREEGKSSQETKTYFFIFEEL